MTIPLSPAFKEEYIKNFDLDDSPLCDSLMFRSLLGAVMQLNDCRPDIAFQLAKISQRQCAPREKDMSALLLLVHYLYGTRNRGVILRRGDRESARTLVKLRGYSDMAWACHGNGKSHYCVCFDLVDEVPGYSELHPLRKIYNTGMFYFKSFMASTVDLATCEGEVGALVEGGKDGIFFRGILRELHQEQVEPTPFYGDNDSTILLETQYSGKHKRVRYMLPKIMWLMEQTKAGVMKLLRLGTAEIPADVGTKNMRGTVMYTKMSNVMGE